MNTVGSIALLKTNMLVVLYLHAHRKRFTHHVSGQLQLEHWLYPGTGTKGRYWYTEFGGHWRMLMKKRKEVVDLLPQPKKKELPEDSLQWLP